MNEEKNSTGKEADRVGIIRAVETPLGFFVLVVLVVEAILGYITSLSSGAERTYLIAGMFALIFALVGVVSFLAYKRPEALSGKRPRNEQWSGPVKEPAFADRQVDGVLQELQQFHGQYQQLLPPRDLLPTIRKLFTRNTFAEKIADCISEDWGTRLRAALLSEKILQAYSQSVSKLGSTKEKAFYEALRGEVHTYCQNMTGLFRPPVSLAALDQLLHSNKDFKKQLPAILPKQEISEDIIARCDANLEKISDLWSSLGFGKTLE